jgi:uncharacterized membrane protein
MTVTPPPAATAPRWMKIALTLSLAANLGVAGLVGGAFLHGAGDGGRPMVRDIGFGPFSEALSPEDRRALRQAYMRDGGDRPREMRQQMRAEMGSLLATLRQDPLGEAGLRAAFAEFQARGQDRLALGQRLLTDRIIAMTPQERAQFADRLEDILQRAPKGDRRPQPGE